MLHIIANWKMELSIKESLDLTKKILKGLKKTSKNVNVVLCPSFTDLEEVGKILKKNKKIGLGAQDLFWEKEGAFTGEVSAKFLKKLGVKYAILGHSERRALGETDKMVRQKVEAALATSIIPIVCVGESWEERNNGLRDEVIIREVRAIFKDLKLGKKKIILAYEPIWAIGTGKSAKPKDSREVEELIKKILVEYIPEKTMEKQVEIIYGGSINSKNISGFVEKGNMKGGLVGGASLRTIEFLNIIEKVS